jgi:hypothetical protein
VLTDDAVKRRRGRRDRRGDPVHRSVFGKQLVVTDTSTRDGRPGRVRDERRADARGGQAVIATQAALDYFFHQFSQLKIRSRIGRRGADVGVPLSATLIRDQLKLLVDERNKRARGAIKAEEAAATSGTRASSRPRYPHLAAHRAVGPRQRALARRRHGVR